MPAAASADDTPTRSTILPFYLQDERYCVGVTRLSSMLDVTDASALENATDPWYAGTIAVAGEQIRVIDLPRIFTTSRREFERTSHPQILVFDTTDDSGAYYGWLVDDVDDSQSVDPRRLEGAPRSGAFVTGRFSLDGTDVPLLDDRQINTA